MKPAFVRQVRSASAFSDTARQVTCDDTGLPGGSLIMTLAGEMPVANLRVGARVVTRDSGTAVLRAVRQRRIVAMAVRIRAGSLGHNRPEHDTTLPAGQPVLVRDWRAGALFGAPQALVPAARLIDGEFVTLWPSAAMTVYDLQFDTPHVLYVDGLELASSLAAPVTS